MNQTGINNWMVYKGYEEQFHDYKLPATDELIGKELKFYFDTDVQAVQQVDDGYRVTTSQGDFGTELLINSAGLNADRIAAMVNVDQYSVYPCRGEYLLLDKSCGDLITGMVYPVPPKVAGVLGVHLTPTVDGNLMIGPSAEFITEREDTRTTTVKLSQLMTEAVFLGLRTVAGIDIVRFDNKFDVRFQKMFAGVLEDFRGKGLLQITPRRCYLTRRGLLLLDTIAAEFVQHIPYD